MVIIRRRSWLSAAMFATIVAGLASRKYPSLFPAFLGKYPGDALWAQMVYWTVGFVFPSASVMRVSFYALTISFLDEFAQFSGDFSPDDEFHCRVHWQLVSSDGNSGMFAGVAKCLHE
jgi:hypothetical protein